MTHHNLDFKKNFLKRKNEIIEKMEQLPLLYQQHSQIELQFNHTVIICICNLILNYQYIFDTWIFLSMHRCISWSLWCGLVACVKCISILIPSCPCVCVCWCESIHVRVYKLDQSWSSDRTHPALLLWTTRSTTINLELRMLCVESMFLNIKLELLGNISVVWEHFIRLIGASDYSFLEHFYIIIVQLHLLDSIGSQPPS